MRNILLIMLLLSPCFANADESARLWGIYSNMSTEQTEPSGIEMFFMVDGRPGRCSASVLLQISEGWPQYPELLDCCGCSVSNVEFQSKLLGKFRGQVAGDVLIGEFISSKFKVKLKRGLSIWQQ